MDVESVIASLEYYGGVAPSIVGQHVRLPGGSWGVASREPLGVVGGVGAWNYPMQVGWLALDFILLKKILSNTCAADLHLESSTCSCVWKYFCLQTQVSYICESQKLCNSLVQSSMSKVWTCLI